MKSCMLFRNVVKKEDGGIYSNIYESVLMCQ